jgi:hypothetical protein
MRQRQIVEINRDSRSIPDSSRSIATAYPGPTPLHCSFHKLP